MEGIPLTPSKVLKGLELRIDGFEECFEILKIKDNGITLTSSRELSVLNGSPISGQISSPTLNLQFRFQGSLERQVRRPDEKGFLLGIQFHRTDRIPDLWIALELAS
ncbi:hypothetical protein EHQ12_01900 [Leptospira gomenensis]|uniref:PilZ domain-containing protein n=1 Tax=Leptospira gomenensis TaxID=2484974 RepID=A0A5F1YH34_9LEPT|nr:hypothetical protein [Leptospira gomenensis]TGK39354.1 hypothetical protein EHQ17_00095 [Leptospira gomenensis]TGK44086.1 hypothetical protein EHQ07_12420 [Leptospira gomenensis]TGK44295.1 hypothetical protein EHQ12_01900 [Leptospira gomenensis]TGK65860.1 hypothetical protein EHQ13_04525 [Leptospira gomenensis]